MSDILVVSSKVKKFIREKSGFNTSGEFLGVLSWHVKKLCLGAIERTRMICVISLIVQFARCSHRIRDPIDPVAGSGKQIGEQIKNERLIVYQENVPAHCEPIIPWYMGTSFSSLLVPESYL